MKRKPRRLAASLALILASVLSAAAQVSPCVTDLGLSECPPTEDGLVVVDDSFNVLAPFDILDRSEIQCAIDCLDGDPETESWPVVIPGSPATLGTSAGGTLDLRADVKRVTPGGLMRVRYVVDGTHGPLYLPFATDRPVVIRGNGATIEHEIGGAPPWCGDMTCLFTRLVPDGATDCDLEVMRQASRSWTMENLTLTATGVGSRAIAIDMAGTEALEIRGCNIEGAFDVGIRLRGATASIVDGCRFHTLGCSHVVAAGRDGCYQGSECVPSQACWLPCDGTNPPVLPGAAPTGPARGSTAAKIIDTHHWFHWRPDGRTIVVNASDGVLIDGAHLDNGRPRHFLERYGQEGAEGDTCLVRNTLLSHFPQEHAAIQNRAPGLMVIDGISYTLPPHLLLLESSESQGQSVVVENSVLQETTTFRDLRPVAEQAAYSFRDCMSETSPADPSRWVNGAGQPSGMVPRRMAVRDTRRMTLPREPEGDPLHGQAWIADDGDLRWCCDRLGNTRVVKGAP